MILSSVMQSTIMRFRADVTIMAFMAAATVMLFVTPLINPEGRFSGLDGSVGYIDHLELWSGTDPVTFITYFLGDMFCPQIESRSFILNGNQMAFCGRDVSIALGLLIGSSCSVLTGRVPSLRTSVIFCLISSVLMMTDWCIQHFMSVDCMATRVVTGLLFGASVSILACALFSDRDMKGDRQNNN